jgi:hypothetical protein
MDKPKSSYAWKVIELSLQGFIGDGHDLKEAWTRMCVVRFGVPEGHPLIEDSWEEYCDAKKLMYKKSGKNVKRRQKKRTK